MTDRRLTGRLVPAVVGLVLVLLVAVVIVLGVDEHDRQRLSAVQRSGGPALTAAATAARTLFSYDHARLDADLASALPLTTAPYTGSYRAAVQRAVWPVARADGTVVVATVRQVAASGATTADRLVALVLVDLTTSHPTAGAAGAAGMAGAVSVEPEQLRITLVRQHGRWLVSAVATV